MKSVDIKGKKYVEVNERIKFFRETYTDWSLLSEIVSLDGDVCVIKATILDENGIVKATGHAYEREGSTFINKTSYIENCETSAWGRALGNLGIGIDTSIASAEEVKTAMLNQEPQKDDSKVYIAVSKINTIPELKKFYADNKFNVNDQEKFYNWICDRQKALKEIEEKGEVEYTKGK